MMIQAAGQQGLEGEVSGLASLHGFFPPMSFLIFSFLLTSCLSSTN